MDNLRNKTTKAISWNAISAVIHQVIIVLVAIILTIILEPEDFGLIAMVTIVSGLAFILNDFGFSNALIQKQDITEEHKSSVFWVNMIIGIILTISFILLAPVLAEFYKEERIIPLMYVMAFDFMIRSTFLVHFAILRKEIRFKELAIRQVVTSSIAGVLTVFVALMGAGVWALVFQNIFTSILNGILIWWIYKWKPKFIFSRNHLRELMAFSLNVSFIRILQYGVQKLDIFLVGRYFDATALGIYSRAFKFQLLPFTAIKSQIASVLFPILSGIQEDFAKQRDVYLKLSGALAMILIPVMLLIFTVADEFVLGILGEKWIDLIPLIKILTVASCAGALGFPGGLFMSNNQTGKQLRLMTFGQVIRVIAVVLGIYFNSLVMLITCVSISIVFAAFLMNYFAVKIISLPFGKLLSSFLPFMGFGLVTLFIVLFIDNLLLIQINDLISLFVKGILFVSIYTGMIWIIRPKPIDFVIETVNPIFKQKIQGMISRRSKRKNKE